MRAAVPPAPLTAPRATGTAAKRPSAAATLRRSAVRIPAPRLPLAAASSRAQARQQRKASELEAVYGGQQRQQRRGARPESAASSAADWDPEAELADAAPRPQPPFVVRHVPLAPLSPQFPPLPESTRWLETGVVVRRRLDDGLQSGALGV